MSESEIDLLKEIATLMKNQSRLVPATIYSWRFTELLRAEDLLNRAVNILEQQGNDQKNAREGAGEFLSPKNNYLQLKFDIY